MLTESVHLWCSHSLWMKTQPMNQHQTKLTKNCKVNRNFLYLFFFLVLPIHRHRKYVGYDKWNKSCVWFLFLIFLSTYLRIHFLNDIIFKCCNFKIRSCLSFQDILQLSLNKSWYILICVIFWWIVRFFYFPLIF